MNILDFMNRNRINSPETAARQKTELLFHSWKHPQAYSVYLGTWAACQAYVELGVPADMESVIDYADSIFDPDDPAKDYIPIAVAESYWGHNGVLVSETEWQIRQEELAGLARGMRRLVELRSEQPAPKDENWGSAAAFLGEPTALLAARSETLKD